MSSQRRSLRAPGQRNIGGDPTTHDRGVGVGSPPRSIGHHFSCVGSLPCSAMWSCTQSAAFETKTKRLSANAWALLLMAELSPVCQPPSWSPYRPAAMRNVCSSEYPLRMSGMGRPYQLPSKASNWVSAVSTRAQDSKSTGSLIQQVGHRRDSESVTNPPSGEPLRSLATNTQ